MDSNHRRRKPADLQSAPVGHLGNLPAEPTILRAGDSAKWGQDVNPWNFRNANFFGCLWQVRSGDRRVAERMNLALGRVVGGICGSREFGWRQESSHWILLLCRFNSLYFD